MANLAETDQWIDGVYQIETTDPVEGGPDGKANLPHKQLASRTKHLRGRVAAAETSLAGKATQSALDALSASITALQTRVAEVEEGMGNEAVAVLTADINLTTSWADMLTVRITPTDAARAMRLDVAIYFDIPTGSSTSIFWRITEGSTVITDENGFGGNEDDLASDPKIAFTAHLPGEVAEQTYKLQAKQTPIGRVCVIEKGTALHIRETGS